MKSTLIQSSMMDIDCCNRNTLQRLSSLQAIHSISDIKNSYEQYTILANHLDSPNIY
jgi:hypothetical protein